ncbi:MAG: NADP-dependent phosphogluconate dehydrogenase [Candidatus Eiseniibacteriota bacterium]|jgi:6-phosphogluconate dehydrogenase
MKRSCELGVVGLGVMGRNLMLNLADHGHRVAGHDLEAGKVAAIRDARREELVGVDSLDALIERLERPRAVLVLVGAGRPVDSVIEELSQRLAEGDVVIDAGNSHFSETDRRAARLAEHGVSLLGVGVSGGADGARHGASIMPGGPREAHARVERLLTDVAARVDDEPCTGWLGPGSAGHYVKMVHNGIEYGLMQLLAECYDVMRHGGGLDDEQVQNVFARWSQGELAGYLVEITAEILRRRDDATGELLIHQVLDAARQKGTGIWTSQDAMDLGCPVPSIDTGVAARFLSALREERVAASTLLPGPAAAGVRDQDLGGPRALVATLEGALRAAMIILFAQGMKLLAQASDAHGYDLSLSEIARIWRGGCIIRTVLLEAVRDAYARDPELPSLLVAPGLTEEVVQHQPALRAVVAGAARLGIPVPGMMAALAYFDGYRRARLPANLIQAQRDAFGAHTYERVDRDGSFHTEWAHSPEVAR